MKYSYDFLVRSQEVDNDKLVTNKAYMEMLSEITMMHGWKAGHTSTEGISPVSWMVLGWKLQILRRLKMFDTAHAATWISRYDKVKAYREYIIYGENGEECAKASAVWVALDGEKGTFRRLSDELLKQFEICDDSDTFTGHSVFPDYQLKQPGKSGTDICSTMEFRVINQMLDYNGHVHNSEYINIADQIIPKEIKRSSLTNVEIFYKQQILPDSMVSLEYTCSEGKHSVFIRDSEKKALHATVVQY